MPAFWLWRCSDSGFQGVNLGIAARICLFTPSCVQRFLISWGKFGNHCRYLPGNVLQHAVILDFRPRIANHCSTIVVAVENSSACSGRLRNGLPHPILFFVAAKENGSPAAAVAATRSASDSILRCRKGEWPACSGRSSGDLPHPNNPLKP